MCVCLYICMNVHTHTHTFMCINVFHLHVYIIPHACKNLIFNPDSTELKSLLSHPGLLYHSTSSVFLFEFSLPSFLVLFLLNRPLVTRLFTWLTYPVIVLFNSTNLTLCIFPKNYLNHIYVSLLHISQSCVWFKWDQYKNDFGTMSTPPARVSLSWVNQHLGCTD